MKKVITTLLTILAIPVVYASIRHTTSSRTHIAHEPSRPRPISKGKGDTQNEFLPVVRIVSYEKAKDGKMNSAKSCSGVVLSDFCLVTAKHCFFDKLGRLYPKMAVWDRRGNKSEVIVSSMRSPSHRAEWSADFALVKLNSSMHSYRISILDSERITPIDFAKVKHSTPDTLGTSGIVAGFGLMNLEEKSLGSGIFQKGDVRIAGDEGVIEDGQPNGLLISYASPSRIEPGDSGGPLFRKDSRGELRLHGIAAAINSWTSDDFEADDLSYEEDPRVMYHVSVLENRNWLIENLKALGCNRM